MAAAELSPEQKRERAKEEQLKKLIADRKKNKTKTKPKKSKFEIPPPKNEVDPTGPLAGLPSVNPSSGGIGGDQRFAQIQGMKDASKDILAMASKLDASPVKEEPKPLADISTGEDVQLGGLFSKKAAESGPPKQVASQPSAVKPD